MRTVIWSRLRRDHGASAVEYALLIAGIAIVMIVAVFFVGSVVTADFQETGSSLGAVAATQTVNPTN
ncbi:MAG TPA: Flp family type IVb pilin [Actinobacteria bacterium]|nr:Flp family type IVb pilin [Actinomycetota bacterium]